MWLSEKNDKKQITDTKQRKTRNGISARPAGGCTHILPDCENKQ